MDMKEKLAEIRNRINVLANQNDLDENEVKELTDLNKEAVKLQAKLDGLKQSEALKAEQEKRIKEERDEAIAAAVKAERERQEAENRRLPDGTPAYQTQFGDTWKYDNMDATELSLFIETANTFKRSGQNIDVPAAAYKALSLRVADMKDDNTEDSRKDVAYVKGSFKAQTATHIEPNKEAVEAAIKAATDPMYSGGSLIGSDWVGTAYSTEIWRSIRADTRVANNIPTDIIPDGYSSKTWPLESTDMTWYKVAEATASDSTLKVPAATVTASQMATANKNITVGKLGSRGIYTGELTEDSLIRFVPQLREQLQRSGAEILEHIIIDGDVETSANKNINDIAGTPASTDVFLLFDGFRKLPLVTNTANSLSAAGGLEVEDFLKILQLMGTAGLAGSDPTKVAFVIDGNVYYKLPQLPELKTKDVHTAASIENGFIKSMYNVPVIPSFQMHRASAARKANTAGKVDVDVTANNTTGSVVAVRWDQWKQAYKRRMTMETTRIANADSWEIVALMRYGLAYRDSEASAILYNVGV